MCSQAVWPIHAIEGLAQGRRALNTPTFTRDRTRAQSFSCRAEAEWARRLGQGPVLATWVGCRCPPEGLDRIVVAEVVPPTGQVVTVSRTD